MPLRVSTVGDSTGSPSPARDCRRAISTAPACRRDIGGFLGVRRRRTSGISLAAGAGGVGRPSSVGTAAGQCRNCGDVGGKLSSRRGRLARFGANGAYGLVGLNGRRNAAPSREAEVALSPQAGAASSGRELPARQAPPGFRDLGRRSAASSRCAISERFWSLAGVSGASAVGAAGEAGSEGRGARRGAWRGSSPPGVGAGGMRESSSARPASGSTANGLRSRGAAGEGAGKGAAGGSASPGQWIDSSTLVGGRCDRGGDSARNMGSMRGVPSGFGAGSGCSGHVVSSPSGTARGSVSVAAAGTRRMGALARRTCCRGRHEPEAAGSA